MDEFSRNLATIIRDSRLFHKLTQEELAEMSGVHRSTINRLEDPLRASTVRYSSLWAVVRALKINPDRIFYFEKYEHYSEKDILLDYLSFSYDEEPGRLISILNMLLKDKNANHNKAESIS